MIASPQHLTNQQSDAPTGSWMQVERWPPNGSTSQEQEKERKGLNKTRLVLHLKVGMLLEKKRKTLWHKHPTPAALIIIY